MRSSEFESQALSNLARSKNQSVSDVAEAIPALGMLAKAVGGMAAKTAGRAVGSAAKKAVSTLDKATGAATGTTTPAQKIAQKTAQKGTEQLAKKVLQKGAKLPIPTQGAGGSAQEFEVDNVSNDEVTLVNPKPKPGDPVKTVHKKQDLDPLLQTLAGQQ